jgi:hypothetical protein
MATGDGHQYDQRGRQRQMSRGVRPARHVNGRKRSDKIGNRDQTTALKHKNQGVLMRDDMARAGVG